MNFVSIMIPRRSLLAYTKTLNAALNNQLPRPFHKFLNVGLTQRRVALPCLNVYKRFLSDNVSNFCDNKRKSPSEDLTDKNEEYVSGSEEVEAESTDQSRSYTGQIPLAKIAGAGAKDRRLMLGFKCKVCQTRNTKFISHLAYTKGVVIVKCVGCNNNHLIADNLGWWKELHDRGIRNVEDLLREKGEEVCRVAFPSNRVETSEQIELVPKTEEK